MANNKCPKCGEKLSPLYFKPKCPKCGCELAYYNIEETLEKDAEKAEKEFEALEKLVKKLTSKKAIKIYISVAALILIAALIVLYFLLLKPNSDTKKNRENLAVNPVAELVGTDNIHFLPTGSSDAVLLESDGHFALIDCAEDEDNPRDFEDLAYTGYEEYVLDYVKKVAAAKDGKVHLDFVLGTHAHSDHIGGFDTLIADDDMVIDKAYLKVYDESKIIDDEVEKWDNKEVYQQMVDALNAKNIPIISEIKETSFTLGNFTINLFNTEDVETEDKVGENDNSIGVLVEKNGAKVFLAADINNDNGDEDRLKDEIGKVDVLKVGHHSYSGSTTKGWLETLSPSVCVITNNEDQADSSTLRRITTTINAPILVTGAEDGVIVSIDDEGTIAYFNHIDT